MRKIFISLIFLTFIFNIDAKNIKEIVEEERLNRFHSEQEERHSNNFSRRYGHFFFNLKNHDFKIRLVPLSGQRVVYLNSEGDNSQKFDSNLPWFSRIKKDSRFHRYIHEGKKELYPLENPIIAFGDLAGGSPLYTGQEYRVGLIAGDLFWKDYADPKDYHNAKLLIKVYDRDDFDGKTTDVEPVHKEAFFVPLKPNLDNWTKLSNDKMDYEWYDNYLIDGGNSFVLERLEEYGLKTTISYVRDQSPINVWNSHDPGIVITHKCSKTKYFFIVELKSHFRKENIPTVENADFNHPKTKDEFERTFYPMYALNFSPKPPQEANHIQKPYFENSDRPPNYLNIDNLRHISAEPAVEINNLEEYKLLPGINPSPELFPHYVLDDFVEEMNYDPAAIASYVQNEIQLIDSLGLPENIDEAKGPSIYPGKVTRGALGVFLEKQGSPWEQCALLVYLLRRAGFAAAYVEGAENELIMDKSRFSRMVHFQLKDALSSFGARFHNYKDMPDKIPVNYPWVVFYDEKNEKWIHLFPWLKNTHVIEGFDLHQFMPEGYRNAAQWVRKYLENDPKIMRHVHHDGNDTAAVLFERFLSEELKKHNLSIDQIGHKIINKKQQFHSWDDFPKPFSFKKPAIILKDLVTIHVPLK